MKYKIKELNKKNISAEFFDTLTNLSDTLDRDMSKANKILKAIKKNKNHRIFVALDEEKQVIGLTTLLIEQKFIHQFGKMGHIEDVVVKKGWQGKGIGGILIAKANKIAKKEGCYRVRLDCCDNNMGFYEKYGYKKHENVMQLDLK